MRENPPLNRDDLKKLSHQRLEDASALLESKCYSGAFYLAGYAVECALKACIARRTKAFDFPPGPAMIKKIYVHDLALLVKSAGLERRLTRDCQDDPELDANWASVKDWNEGSRYRTWTRVEARGLVEAIADRRHGVLKWISQHW